MKKITRNLLSSFKTALYFLAIICLTAFSHPIIDKNQDQMKHNYEVLACDQAMVINADWNKSIWKTTKSVKLENFMGDRPDHFPAVEMKMRYDKDNIYVIFKVEDTYVRAIAKETNGKVWEDSCVEFFFTPGPSTESGYFNLETNCIGTFLMEYHNQIANDDGFVSKNDNQGIEIKSSLAPEYDNEHAGPLTWYLEYKLPHSILLNYLPYEQPGPGVKWRANFYKCGDKTSHPHWLTWAPVDFPQPKFHLPEFFGWLEFK